MFDFSKNKSELLQRLREASLGESQYLISTFTDLRDVVPSYSEPLRAVSFRSNTSLTRVLFASGQFDPQTPQYYADALFPSVVINSTNPQARLHLSVPKSTHIQTLGVPCGQDVASAFVKGDDAGVQTALAAPNCAPEPLDYQYAAVAAATPVGAFLGVASASDIWDQPLGTSSTSGSLSPGAIAGIVVAVVAIIAIVIVIVILVVRRKNAK